MSTPSSLVALFCCLILLLGSLPGSAQDKILPTFPESEAGKHVGEEVTITGKVVAVAKSGKGTTYLNFGDRFPRHTFSGTVLARDEAKVGDMKVYEGKTVAITGRIELAQDQKPQILISAPTQIKAVDGESAAPAPAPAAPVVPAPTASTSAPPPPSMPATPSTPVPPPSPTVTAAPAAPAAPVKPSELKKMVLGANWNSPAPGGEMTRKDLAAIFGGQGTASDSLEGDPSVIIFGDVPFLAPLVVAKKKLQVEGVADSALRVNCPGLPIGSLTAHGFTGIFAGGFNRLYIVTDLAEQVVSVLLVDENTRQRTSDLVDTAGYHTYNFIAGRSRGTNELIVRHQLAQGSPKGVVVVESMLIDPTDNEAGSKTSSSSRSSSKSSSSSRSSKTGKVMERSRWYVPTPMVNVILRCVGSR